VGDATGVAAALHTVLTDEERATAIVEAGSRRLSAYSWDRTADDIVELYRRAAAAR
jgi:glycosyltransferase involved in cell wall biosynthesis